MTEEQEKQLIELAEQVDRLTRLVETPDSGIADRVDNIETQVADAVVSDSTLGDVAAPPEHPPDTKVDYIPERKPLGGDVLPFQIEFGKPTAEVTTDVYAVTLQPCDVEGVSYASADTVTVFVTNDGLVQSTADRGWDTDTVLSFIRFSPWYDDDPVVEGVLIGEANLTGLNSVPFGVIVMWGGAVGDIPSGWTLCDGGDDGNSVATPDLSGMFIAGYNSSDGDYDIGDTGGFTLHGPSEPAPGNDHESPYRVLTTTSTANPFAYFPNDSDGDPVDTDNRPPFYTLAFIRKD